MFKGQGTCTVKLQLSKKLMLEIEDNNTETELKRYLNMQFKLYCSHVTICNCDTAKYANTNLVFSLKQ